MVLVDGSAKDGHQLQPWAVIYWNMLLQVSGKLTGNRGGCKVPDIHPAMSCI